MKSTIRERLFTYKRPHAPSRVPSQPRPQIPATPSRASTMDSLDRELRALGLDSAPSSPSSPSTSEPPPYSEIAQDAPVQSGVGRPGSAAEMVKRIPDGPCALADPTTDELLAEEQLLDRATAFIHDAATDSPSASNKRYPALAKPVVVPRLNPGATVPFARGWAPALAQQGISQDDFLTFLDNLNVVGSPHPAVLIMQLAAFGLSFAPLDMADALSGVLQLASVATAEVMARARRKRYFARMNDGFFHPRGLHVRVVGTKALKRALGVPADDTLVLPLAEATLDMTAQARCLRHLETWTAYLETEDLPPPSPQTGLLTRLAAWQVRRKLHEFDRGARKCRKRAWKRLQKGKKPREMVTERWRIRFLSWVLIQNLGDYEREVEGLRRQKEIKRQTGTTKRLFGKARDKDGENVKEGQERDGGPKNRDKRLLEFASNNSSLASAEEDCSQVESKHC